MVSNLIIHKYYIQYLARIIPKLIKKIYIFKSEIIVYTYFINVKHLMFFLKNHTYSRFKSLSDLCAVDYPNRLWRFEVVYNLLSIDFSSRIRVKVKVDEVLGVKSIVDIFPGANWYEREAWDMFGIFFENHPDLRRILTDYGFDGFPLRKDFPLSGYLELRYSDTNKKILYEPVQLSQEYRFFGSISPIIKGEKLVFDFSYN
jgi:NADH dehydrogenase (ubiquinone) Fe-S protein 3